MIVPEYWAEARVKDTINGRQLTVRRFGWSDECEQDALQNAKQRADEAMKRAQAGETVRKTDHKVAYNGAEGLPIREEIISRHQDSIITRNTYGALCLNTPDVLFADIDFEIEPSFTVSASTFLGLAALSIAAGFYTNSVGVGFAALFGFGMLTSLLAKLFHKLRIQAQGGHEHKALEKINVFVDSNPSWNLRIYRTPLGYRVLVMHKTFNPKDDDAQRFLEEINSDPLYVQMCKNQNCFRARISPKPWRIGISRIGPNSGIWPIRPERLPGRAQWVNNYNQLAADYASCRFITQLGSSFTDAKADLIRGLHDQHCKADSDLPIA